MQMGNFIFGWIAFLFAQQESGGTLREAALPQHHHFSTPTDCTDHVLNLDRLSGRPAEVRPDNQQCPD